MPDKRIGGCALLTLAVLPLSGAVIRGVVVEHQTGRVLSRAAVSLQPVPGTPGEARSTRTNSFGQFEFDALAAGAYVIRAARRGFMTMEYGQKRWDSSGIPVSVTADESPFLNIRLPRYSGITGTVVDENDVGLPDMEVVAYRAAQPPTLVARGKSDDRGVYRIAGLPPGTYLVRSAAGGGDFIDYLPTFSRETLRAEEGHQVQVSLDDDARNVDVRPIPGKLFSVSGTVTAGASRVGPITVTLASDMGRRIARGAAFRFPDLPPGRYELYAEAREDSTVGAGFQSAHMLISVSGNTSVQLLLATNETRFECTPPPPDGQPTQILARRVDLAGAGPAVMLKPQGNRAALALGRWELMVQPPAGYHVSAITGGARPSGRVERPDAWNEVAIRPFTSVRFQLAAGGGSLRGVVKARGEPVAGAPVHLEAYDPVYRKRLMEPRVIRTGMWGEYQFDGLAPGTYRVLATFEYQTPDTAVMDMAPAASVRMEARGSVQADLALYELR